MEVAREEERRLRVSKCDRFRKQLFIQRIETHARDCQVSSEDLF